MSNDQKDSTRQSEPQPIIRYVRLPTLTVYEVSEDELQKLEQGSPASIFLNFAIFLLSIAVSFTTTLLTTQIPSDRLYTTFLVFTILGYVLGLLFGILTAVQFKRSKSIGKIIRQRAAQSSATPPLAEHSPVTKEEES